MNQADTIQHILSGGRTVAVVGLSPNPQRDSHEVAQYMQAHGWTIVPVNPNATQVLGQTCYPTLADAAKHHRIDLVNCFRNSEDIPPIVDAAIAIGAPAIWMQLGVAHAQAAEKARAAGLWVVENRCLKIDHAASLHD